MLDRSYAIPRSRLAPRRRPRRPRGGAAIDHPDLRPGSGIFERVSGLDAHRHTHPPGCAGGSAGRVVFPVRRPRGGSGIGRRERHLDAGARIADLHERHGRHRPLLPREQPGGAQWNHDHRIRLLDRVPAGIGRRVFGRRPPASPPTRPSTPTGLEASSVASTRVALSWSPSTGSVAGYTLYRDGSPIGTARPDTTTFLDADTAPAASYTYSVDAFDLADDHSAPSAPLTVTTPAASPEFVQGAAASSADRLSSDTLTLPEPVSAGDLLVGWFSQFNAPGEVQVSDNVNGPWTRSASTTFSGSGDIALYYRENSAAAPSGLTITVSASAPAYLQEAVANFRHVATAGALDQTVLSEGTGTHASVGPSASVPAGELVVAAALTGGQPASATPGSSQRVPYVLDVRNGSASSLLEDILSSVGGPQDGSLTLGTATNWFMVLATFRPASTTGTTQPATTTTTTTRPPPTSTSTTRPTTSTTRPA